MALAVNTAGFVPLAAPADAEGKYGYEMEILVPASSSSQSPADLKGKSIAFTTLSSNSGAKAPLVILKSQFQMLPVRDYQYVLTGSHQRSLKEFAAGTHDAACVANDMLARAVAAGEIQPEQYRSIYKSESFPPLCLGCGAQPAAGALGSGETGPRRLPVRGDVAGEVVRAAGQGAVRPGRLQARLGASPQDRRRPADAGGFQVGTSGESTTKQHHSLRGALWTRFGLLPMIGLVRMLPAATFEMPRLVTEGPEEGPSNWVLLRRMLALSWRYRWGCLKVLALQLSVTLLSLAALAATGLAIDLVHHFADPRHPLPRGLPLSSFASLPPLGIIAVMSLAVLALGVLRAVLTYCYHVAAARLVHEQIIVDLRAQVYDKLQRLSFRFFDNNASSGVINRVTGDVQAVRMFIDGVLIQMVIVLLVAGRPMSPTWRSIHPGLTLACLATTPIMWGLSSLFARVVRPAYDRNRQLVDRLILVLSENVQGVQVVKGFAREREEVAKFAAANAEVQDQQQRIFWRVSLYTPVMSLLTQVNLVILLAYGGYLVIEGQLSLGTGLIVFVGLLQQFSSAGVQHRQHRQQHPAEPDRRTAGVRDPRRSAGDPERPAARARSSGSAAQCASTT